MISICKPHYLAVKMFLNETKWYVGIVTVISESRSFQHDLQHKEPLILVSVISVFFKLHHIEVSSASYSWLLKIVWRSKPVRHTLVTECVDHEWYIWVYFFH